MTVPSSASARPSRGSGLSRVVATLAVAALAGWLFERIGSPLPWMIGPLLATALAGVAGAPLATWPPLRNGALVVIGVALGLYFTPAVLALLLGLAPAMAVGTLWAFVLGYGFYRWLWWLHRDTPGLHRSTAFYAAAIGGASEMAMLAEHHAGQVDRVAAAHSLRVLMVVVAIPFGLQWAGVRGVDVFVPGTQQVHAGGLLMLSAAAAAGVALLWWWRWPNPWVMGALAVTMLLTGSGVVLSALPAVVVNAAQLLLAVGLGVRFTPEFVQAAPRWLLGVAGGTLAMIVASAGLAWWLAGWTGLHPATLLLATSPGGIAEMSITAKVLQLGVPVVTALHLVRYVAVLTLTEPLFRWEMRRVERSGPPGRRS